MQIFHDKKKYKKIFYVMKFMKIYNFNNILLNHILIVRDLKIQIIFKKIMNNKKY